MEGKHGKKNSLPQTVKEILLYKTFASNQKKLGQDYTR
jgi:hypothetical protein